MPQTVRVIISAVLLLANLGVALRPVGAEVLCIGADGHIALESPSIREACCGSHRAEIVSAEGNPQISSSCCQDIPVVIDAPTTARSERTTLLPAAQQVPSIVFEAYPLVSEKKLLAGRPTETASNSLPRILFSLRTVVILV